MNSNQILPEERDGIEAMPHNPNNSSFASDSYAIDGLDNPTELDGEADCAWREAVGQRLHERLKHERVIASEEGKHALD